MWNYYKTVVINSSTTEDDKPVFFTTDSYATGKKVADGLVNV